MTLEILTSYAREHVTQLEADIEKSKTREEHIRMTTRLNEAIHLLDGIIELYGAPTSTQSPTGNFSSRGAVSSWHSSSHRNLKPIRATGRLRRSRLAVVRSVHRLHRSRRRPGCALLRADRCRPERVYKRQTVDRETSARGHCFLRMADRCQFWHAARWDRTRDPSVSFSGNIHCDRGSNKFRPA